MGNRVFVGSYVGLRFPQKMTIINFPITSTEQEASEALDTLMRVFDISDVSGRETVASLDYNQGRIDVAREALKQNPNERERIVYGAWLDFFQGKTDEARGTSPSK